jgi:hypothetical protein
MHCMHLVEANELCERTRACFNLRHVWEISGLPIYWKASVTQQLIYAFVVAFKETEILNVCNGFRCLFCG